MIVEATNGWDALITVAVLACFAFIMWLLLRNIL